jgi:hypothetical protein
VALSPRAFNCDKCRCDANHDAGYPKWKIPGVLETSVCPRYVVTARSNAWVSLYGHYKNGHLLVKGGLCDQPNVYLEAMQVIDAHLGSRDAE